MTDLRITDEVDQAMVRDMNDVPEARTRFLDMAIQMAVEAEDEKFTQAPAPQPPVVDEQTLKLLTDLGFDHVPTADEVKARLDARREEIRNEVLFQADRRDWCDDGTRQVCANLRLKRPGYRDEKKITIRATVEYTVDTLAYSDKGALLKVHKYGRLPLGDQFAGGRLASAEIHEVKIGDTAIELTDALWEEIRNA